MGRESCRRRAQCAVSWAAAEPPPPPPPPQAECGYGSERSDGRPAPRAVALPRVNGLAHGAVVVKHRGGVCDHGGGRGRLAPVAPARGPRGGRQVCSRAQRHRARGAHGGVGAHQMGTVVTLAVVMQECAAKAGCCPDPTQAVQVPAWPGKSAGVPATCGDGRAAERVVGRRRGCRG